MRRAISVSSSLGVKSTSRLTKLKRTPRTPAACRSASSRSVTLRRTVATPRARPPEAAKSWCFDASQGVYLRSGANGNSSPGPKTWQCASTAPSGTLNRGVEGSAYQSSQPGVLSNGMRRTLSRRT